MFRPPPPQNGRFRRSFGARSGIRNTHRCPGHSQLSGSLIANYPVNMRVSWIGSTVFGTMFVGGCVCFARLEYADSADDVSRASISLFHKPLADSAYLF